MSQEENVLLEKAVVNLTVENARLKVALDKSKENEDMWYKSYKNERERAAKAEQQLNDVQEKTEELASA